MAASPLDTYRREIERAFERGDATEHTHRPALKTLIEALSHGVTATNEPKRVECGAPDFVISRRTKDGPVTVGYVEAKDVGKPLGEVEKSEQMKRYLSALPNLILTNYLEFRWYVDGEARGDPARLAHVAKGGKLTPVKGPERRASRLALRGVRHRAGARQFVARVRSQARSVRAYEVLRRIPDLPREAGRV